MKYVSWFLALSILAVGETFCMDPESGGNLVELAMPRSGSADLSDFQQESLDTERLLDESQNGLSDQVTLVQPAQQRSIGQRLKDCGGCCLLVCLIGWEACKGCWRGRDER